MGGIIRGFIGGAGKAMSQAGQMLFADKIAKERSEAEFLRNQALRREETATNQEFRTSERVASQDFTAEQKEADTKSRSAAAAEKAKTDSSLQSQRDKAAMERSKLSASSKQAKNPQLIQYTDSKGNEQEGVLRSNSDGSFTIVKPDGVTTMEEGIKPSTSDIAQAAKEYKDRAKIFESDKSQFGMTESKWKKRRAVEIALERQSGQGGSGPGIVAPAIQSAAGTKKIGNRDLTKQQFVDAMVEKYGDDSMDDILQTWDSIK